MLKHATTVLLFLAGAPLLVDGGMSAAAESRLPSAKKQASPTSFIGWIAVALLQTTSRSGRPAKMLDGASNFPRLAG